MVGDATQVLERGVLKIGLANQIADPCPCHKSSEGGSETSQDLSRSHVGGGTVALRGSWQVESAMTDANSSKGGRRPYAVVAF